MEFGYQNLRDAEPSKPISELPTRLMVFFFFFFYRISGCEFDLYVLKIVWFWVRLW